MLPGYFFRGEKLDRKKYLKYVMILTAVFVTLIVFVSGPINSFFAKFRHLKMELPLFGTLIFFIVCLLIELIVFLFLKQVLDTTETSGERREKIKQKIYKTPGFTVLLVLLVNIFGPIVIYFHFLSSGRVGLIHYVLGETVIFVTTAIFASVMYLVIHHLTFEFLYESDFLTPQEKEKELPVFVDRKVTYIMNGFSVFTPLAVLLLTLGLYNVNNAPEGGDFPMAMFIFIALIAGFVVIVVQNLLSNLWYEKVKKLDCLKQQDKDLKFDPKLTAREVSIVKLLVKGYTNQEIGGSLYMSVPAVKKSLSVIYEKLGVKNRSQLIALFIEKE